MLSYSLKGVGLVCNVVYSDGAVDTLTLDRAQVHKVFQNPYTQDWLLSFKWGGGLDLPDEQTAMAIRKWHCGESKQVGGEAEEHFMIPPFNEHGYLPPGIHPATMDEIDVRFGTMSELRRVQMESVRWLVELAKHAGVERIILNGSFVTDIIEPNDVDCLLLVGPRNQQQLAAIKELRKGLPFLAITLARPRLFDEFANDIYATDRSDIAKGMVEVTQWN